MVLDAHFLGYFAGHGFGAYAVSLRGHGNSEGEQGLRWARIADYVEDVAEIVRRLAMPPVLIGHSMGGFVIQKYLGNHTAPGAVLPSPPSPRGLVGTALRIAGRRPLVFAKVNLALSLLPVIATPQLTREAFFSQHFPENELEAYHAECDIIPDVAHDSMLETRWQRVAARILTWLNERGL